MQERKFLFFIEREFHISLLKNVMLYIHHNKLGTIGINSFNYQSSTKKFAESGLRMETIREELKIPIKIVTKPHEFAPDITFMADFSYQYVEGLGKIVNIGHGTISKGWFFTGKSISSRENCADLLCVPGSVHKEVLRKQVYTRTVVTGMPKLDTLFANLNQKENLLKKFRLSPEKKTILLAPTFNEELSLMPYLNSQFFRYIPKKYNLIIKLHGAAAESKKQEIREISHMYENIYFYNAKDISNALIAADMLISDMSSVIFEFSALNRPILLFDNPMQKHYPNYDPQNIEYKYRNVGIIFRDVKQLPYLIEKNFKKDSNEAQRYAISNKFIAPETRGKSSEIVVKKALELLDNSKKKAALVFDTNKQERVDSAVSKYAAQFEIFFVDNGLNYKSYNKIKFEDNFLNNLKKIVRKSQSKELIYMNGNWSYSPLFPNLLLNHLKLEDNVGLAVPILSETDQQLDPQFVSYHFKRNDIPLSTFGLQLSYSAVGMSQEIEYPLSKEVFAIRTNVLEQAQNLDTENLKANWAEIIKSVYTMNYKIKIAQECLCYDRLQEEVMRQYETTENEIFPVIKENENELKKSLSDDPFNQKIILKLIYHYYYTEQYDSVNIYADMLEDNPEAILVNSLAYSKQNDTEEALHEINKIQTERINNSNLRARIYTQKAALNLRKKYFDSAKSFLEKAYEINPKSKEVNITFGTYFLFMNEIYKSKPFFRNALKADIKNPKALYGMGLVASQEENHEEAVNYLSKCLEYDEENINAIKSLLTSSYKIGKFSNIEHALENYLELHPADLNFLFTLAGIKYKLNKREEALNIIEKIEIFDPNFNGLQEFKNQVL